jgi:hypothetical protein
MVRLPHVEGKSRSMPEREKPTITSVVYRFGDDKHWHDALTTRDEAEACALLEVLGNKGRIEEFRPRTRL